jgi:hypothetical protein
MQVYIVNQGTNPPIIFDNQSAADYYADIHNKKYPNIPRAFVTPSQLYKGIINHGNFVNNAHDYIFSTDI